MDFEGGPALPSWTGPSAAYMLDAMTLLGVIQPKDAVSFLHSYFTAVNLGAHVANREFEYISNTQWSRLSWASWLQVVLQDAGYIDSKSNTHGSLVSPTLPPSTPPSIKLSVADATAVITLVCTDFPQSIIEQAVKASYIPNTPLSWNSLLPVLQLYLIRPGFAAQAHRLFSTLARSVSDRTENKGENGESPSAPWEVLFMGLEQMLAAKSKTQQVTSSPPSPLSSSSSSSSGMNKSLEVPGADPSASSVKELIKSLKAQRDIPETVPFTAIASYWVAWELAPHPALHHPPATQEQ